MPLLKNKESALAEPPENLQPKKRVWQIRFTKEIFRDYEDYIRRLNTYRQRVWKCKATGKIHLTYEEALMSEHQASERIQQFPKEFIQVVLSTIQFSTVSLNELMKMINGKLKDSFVEGEELHGRNGNSLRPCRILKVLTTYGGKSCELGWLDEEGKVVSTSTEDSKSLVRKKPFTRDLLKLFIKESTSQSDPWVIHENLAIKHGISTEPPEELQEKIVQNPKAFEELESKKTTSLGKSRRMENDELASAKRTKTGRLKALKIKYPIDDLLVKPSKDDPSLSERPIPSTSFIVPMDIVGDILMVWDFCSSFSKILRLSPFSVEDFENGIVYEGPSNLIVEIHIAILNLLINYHENYHSLILGKKRKEMVTSTKWPEYLCDFMELEGGPNAASQLGKIKQGNYFLLGVHDKIEILGGLVYCVLSTEVIRWQLDKYIDKLQALVAAKREDDLEERRKKKEERQLREMELNDNESLPGNSTSATLQVLGSTSICVQNKDAQWDVHMKADTPSKIQQLGDGENKRSVLESRRTLMKQRLETKLAMEREKEAARMIQMRRQQKETRVKVKEARERKEKEQRNQHFDREMEKRFIRTDALGKDRNYNQYWFFHQEGRVFIESADHTKWGFYTTKEELDGVIASLNPKGVRELGLQRNLQKHYTKICAALQKRMKETAQRLDSDTAILRRSVRVSVRPNDCNQPPFLKYVNKWRV